MKVVFASICLLVLINSLIQCDAKSFNQNLKRSSDMYKQENENHVQRRSYNNRYGQDEDDIIIIDDNDNHRHHNDNSLLFLLPLLFGNRNRGGLFSSGYNNGFGSGFF